MLKPSRLAFLISLIFPASFSLAQTAAPDSTVPNNAETSAAGKSAKDGKQQVVVTGTRGNDTDQRRQASAAKLIFGREELDRNGDTSLGEVLKRLPGVSIGGRAGRGGEIRMRGMGGGYTQILINGERAPRGFSLESLSPDQVERIEVIRGSVAEHSTQAIAGTINIILREGYQQRDVQLNITDTIYEGKQLPNVSVTVPGKVGNLTYTLAGTLAQNERSTTTLTSDFDLDSNGQQLFQEDSFTQSHNRSDVINFSPRLAWKFENGDSLTLQSFAMHNHSQDEGRTNISEVQ
ncbi:MAG: TonB-dependent receptor plug domain-containing protein, partial [Burkholderiales bacterium]|nr:TonB-dependent receptor plug domain-containing protein [Burkholderiales bacterium]